MINRNKILKMVVILAGIAVLVGALTHISKQNSMTLGDYAAENPELAYAEKDVSDSVGDTDISENSMDGISENNFGNAADSISGNIAENGTDNVSGNAVVNSDTTENLQNNADAPAPSTLIGASLNGEQVIEQRTTYAESFYYEPLSDNLRRYITGVSFPAVAADAENAAALAITYEDLCYLHILHYDFEGNPAEGELICNAAIAQDLVEIFYELYRNEYQLEKVRLIDEYDGDDTASMEDNNTSCFNYRVVDGTTSLSKHAMGLALDINPFYNPYITYEKDESGNIVREKVSPEDAWDYADRSKSFPYKIDENDLCYKLFTQYGFTWGGNWNSCKDYQHFQKVVDY